MREISLYKRLNLRSKRALVRTAKRYGRPYQYMPRPRLVARLCRETGRSEQSILDGLYDLREELLSKKDARKPMN